jgi:iron complex transport system ATP-binding protein
VSNLSLQCRQLRIAVEHRVLVDNLNIELQPGAITCVLGRNGTGKSLTLRTLAGLRAFEQGELLLNHQSIHLLARKQVAQSLAFVAQEIEEPFPVTVLEYAVSGRHPHINFWQWETQHDYDIAQQSLSAVDLQEFTARNVQSLSGGERRRLAIATALTQQPQIFVLDEPINHLDPQHQLQVLKLMRSKAEQGCIVIMSLHDPNLALQFADHALLLFGNGQWEFDDVSIVDSSKMTALYQTPMKQVDMPNHGRWISLQL